MKQQRGFGLVEILISLLLASLLLTAVIQQYMQIKQHDKRMLSAFEQAFELQWVADFLQLNIRKAGFTPCLNIEYLNSLDRRTGQRHLTAFSVAHGTNDRLQINRMREEFGEVMQVVSPTQLLVSHAHALSRHYPILIADCYHAEVQELVAVTQVSTGHLLTLRQPLAFTYYAPIYMGEWLQQTFFIHTDAGVGKLYYQHQQTDELSPLVHRLVFKIQQQASKVMILTELGVENERTLKLETLVRT